jgi:hypothetical protein
VTINDPAVQNWATFNCPSSLLSRLIRAARGVVGDSQPAAESEVDALI